MTQDFEKRYIAARRKIIEADFANLNPQQRLAALTTEGPLLLLAGAGSGKTTVLIHRIVNLLRYGRASDSDEVPENATEEDLAVLEAGPSERARALCALEPVAPWRILAITFTNKAAGELKSRLEAALGPEANDVWAQTFHSACVRILRRDAERLGFSRSFTIYDTADSQSLVKRVLKDMDLDEKMFPPRFVLSQISRAKDEMLPPEEMLAEAKKAFDVRATRTAEVYREYQRRLREADAMDFDDLISYTVQLLQEHEDVREYYQRKFRYVLVDEYQDTNNLQYLLASLLAGGYENICVVGDDDQSIYKFRGATIRNILDFEKRYPGAKMIKLEQNYRSTAHILEAANAVIRNNTGRKGKELWTAAGDGARPVLYAAANENEEAQYVADRILDDFQRGVPWGEHAVLYRMNAQSNQLEYAFKRRGIPYRVYGGMKFFDRAEVKDMLAYLSVLENPADDLRLTRIINTPTRGIGASSIEKASRLALEHGVPLFEILRRAGDYPDLQRSALRLRQFAVMIEELRTLAGSAPADELYDALIERTGYVRALREKDTPENAARIENVKELKSNIVTYIEESGDASLHGFLDEVALYTDLDGLEEGADCVVMMTIHASKGLEFPTVFIVGMEEGIFPGVRAIGEPEELEEERRLCYVAMTRAMRRLYMTCAAQRMLFGRTSNNRVSRFLEEIPEEHLEQTVPRRSCAAPVKDGGGYPSASKKPRQPAPVHAIVTPATATAPPPAFRVGDEIVHNSFGPGVITALTPMGGDHLVEIAFEQAGTKRLMLKAAARLMKKA